MPTSIKLILSLLILAISAHADASFRWGVAGEAGVILIDDPNGSVNGTFIGSAITGSFDLRQRGQRVTSGVGYINASADASSSSVGQNVSGYYLFSRWEHRVPLFRSAPESYFYVGGKALQTTHKDRHTVQSGFLSQRYDNRKDTSVNLTFGASYQIDHGRSTSSIPGVFVDFPVSGSSNVFGIFYQFNFQ